MLCRSRSESDAEDKLAQPPAKKRPGRRRGRQESQDEVLDLGDSENIEQLSAEDGVSYRCKLCHYTSPRVPLIRLHMRTHRQKVGVWQDMMFYHIHLWLGKPER